MLILRLLYNYLKRDTISKDSSPGLDSILYYFFKIIKSINEVKDSHRMIDRIKIYYYKKILLVLYQKLAVSKISKFFKKLSDPSEIAESINRLIDLLVFIYSIPRYDKEIRFKLDDLLSLSYSKDKFNIIYDFPYISEDSDFYIKSCTVIRRSTENYFTDDSKDHFAISKVYLDIKNGVYHLDQTIYDCTSEKEFNTSKVLENRKYIFYDSIDKIIINPYYMMSSTIDIEDYSKFYSIYYHILSSIIYCIYNIIMMDEDTVDKLQNKI